jgi:hypothetical protein
MAEVAVELRDAGERSLADKILAALNRGERRLALSHDERHRLIPALDDPRAGLEELRAVLIEEHAGRASGRRS